MHVLRLNFKIAYLSLLLHSKVFSFCRFFFFNFFLSLYLFTFFFSSYFSLWFWSVISRSERRFQKKLNAFILSHIEFLLALIHGIELCIAVIVFGVYIILSISSNSMHCAHTYSPCIVDESIFVIRWRKIYIIAKKKKKTVNRRALQQKKSTQQNKIKTKSRVRWLWVCLLVSVFVCVYLRAHTSRVQCEFRSLHLKFDSGPFHTLQTHRKLVYFYCLFANCAQHSLSTPYIVYRFNTVARMFHL